MMTEFKRTQRDYPLSFKIAVVEQVEKGEMTYKQAQQRYGIQGRSTVHVSSWGTADRHGIRTTQDAENGRRIMHRFLILLPVSDVVSPESVCVSRTIC